MILLWHLMGYRWVGGRVLTLTAAKRLIYADALMLKLSIWLCIRCEIYPLQSVIVLLLIQCVITNKLLNADI